MNLIRLQAVKLLGRTVVEGGDLSTLLELVEEFTGHGAPDTDVDGGLVAPHPLVEGDQLCEDRVPSQALSNDRRAIVVPINDQMALLEPVDDLHDMERGDSGRVLRRCKVYFL